MSASPEQRAKREAMKVAAVALRRDGHTTAECANILGKSARYIRSAVQGEDLDPPPADAKRKAKRRKAPRAFKHATGRALKPILLYDSGGGFGILPETVSAAGLGPNIPIGGADEFGRVKMSEQVLDMGTTLDHDQRRYDSARQDASWADMEIPEGATRVIREHEDGSRSELDLRTLKVRPK